MQAVITRVSDPLMLDHLTFPDVGLKVKTWLKEQLYAPMQHLVGIGTDFMVKARESYENLNNAMRLSNLKNALANMNGDKDPNAIEYITSFEAICDANPVTQRYIMALPELRQQYHLQRIDGFSGTYHDLQPDAVGRDHRDYRRVTDGILMVNGETLTHTEYYEGTMFDEAPLSFAEQSQIIGIWDIILGSDPSRDYTMIR